MSENIPYIIAEDGYYYVAYKEKVKSPYIVVSSKGVANGLSEEYNDGWDFGPDSYSPTSTSAIPYTETTGFQEAWNYAGSIARYSSLGSGYILPEVRFLDGKFDLNADVTMPLFPNAELQIPAFSIIGTGYGYIEGGTLINGNSYHIYIGKSSYVQTGNSSFLISGINFLNTNIVIAGDYAANPNCIIRDVSLLIHGNATATASLDLSNTSNFAQLDFDNIFSIIAPVSIGGAYQLSATSFTAKEGFYIGNSSNPSTLPTANKGTRVNQIGVVNMAEGIQINYGDTNASFAVWEIDNNGTGNAGLNGITNNVPSGDTFTLNIEVGTMVINTTTNFFVQNSGAGTLNVKMHIKHLTLQTAVNDFTVPSGINIEEFTVDEITNLTSTGTSSANLPILSSTSGTTAGTVSMRFNEYASSHKKIIITFNGYENDTTTDQTVGFPMAFSNSAIITGNNTGLTISASTTGITITAPDSTTTYSGIVIVEGY